MVILPSGTTPPAFDPSLLRATSGTVFTPLPSSGFVSGSSSSYIIPVALALGGLLFIVYSRKM